MNDKIIKIIEQALVEDGYNNDLTTTTLIDKHQMLSGNFLARASGVVSGIDVVQEVFKKINNKIEFKILRKNGSFVNRGDVIAYVKGSMRDILRGEQVALNFLKRMSGIASITNRFVQELKGTNCKVLDTRGTTPLLRILDQQAVQDGGGINHALDLSERFIITKNHLASLPSISKAVEMAKGKLTKDSLIEVEVENKEEFVEALDTSCDIIILNMMSNELMNELATLNKMNESPKTLIASGNMTLTRVRSVALLGINYLIIDGLTISYKALDVSLRFYKKI